MEHNLEPGSDASICHEHKYFYWNKEKADRMHSVGAS